MWWTLLPCALISWIVVRCIYRISFHPLRHIPGPVYAKISSLWLVYHQYIGDSSTAIHGLHNVFGPTVRVGPNDIDMAKNDALGPIYFDQGGFEKSEYYRKYDIDGYPTIFSTLSQAMRTSRAKAVLPIFSAQSIKEATESISGFADKLVHRMGMEAKTGGPVDLLKLTRAFAMDAVTTYIFQCTYGGLDESSALLSAYPFIDFVNWVGGLFWIPHSSFVGIQWLFNLIHTDHKTKTSFKTMDLFVESLLNQAKAGGGSYPSRLLAKGIPVDEVVKESVDIAYAGTDSTGHILAIICWNLVANPEQYATLRDEVEKNTATGPSLQTLPYLNGVVKEGLRVSMANPCRFPRVVPPQGLSYGGYYIPAKANVGVSASELHLDPTIFPQPEKFLPDRWLNPTSDMNTNLMPFGKGARSCLARSFATAELFIAIETIARANVLQGAKRVKDKIEIYEWFNCQVKDRVIELIWSDQVS